MKREDLPRLSKADMVRLGCFPLYVVTKNGYDIHKRVFSNLYNEWDALKIIDLPNISARSKRAMVLSEFFLPSMLLHEFACRCAEYMLSLVDNPDHRFAEAIRVKRLWINGNATDREIAAAREDMTIASSDKCREPFNLREQGDALFCVLCATGYDAENAAIFSSERVAKIDTAHKEPDIAILRELIEEWEN